jgi:hypothetical protein
MSNARLTSRRDVASLGIMCSRLDE